MLIFTRRIGETVRIGDDIQITILAMNRGHMRIGITAPQHIAVHRQEVYQKIKQQQANGLEGAAT